MRCQKKLSNQITTVSFIAVDTLFFCIYASVLFSQPETTFSIHLSLTKDNSLINFQHLASYHLSWGTFPTEFLAGLNTSPLGCPSPLHTTLSHPTSHCLIYLCLLPNYELLKGQSCLICLQGFRAGMGLVQNNYSVNTYRLKGEERANTGRPHSLMLTLATLHCCNLTSASSHSSSSSNQPIGSSSPRSSDERPILL